MAQTAEDKELSTKVKEEPESEPQSGLNSERTINHNGSRPHWRFEDLEIWQLAAELAVKFHRLAEQLDERRLYRYADQLRGAGLSLSNNKP
jgi:23S rRNA-intervening sequence protein